MDGMFKHDLQNGFGRIKVLKEDAVYEGEFVKGSKEGWGVLAWPDGSKLEGHWSKGKINGVVREI